MGTCAFCGKPTDKPTGHDQCFDERDNRLLANQCIACKKPLSKDFDCTCTGEYKGYNL